MAKGLSRRRQYKSLYCIRVCEMLCKSVKNTMLKYLLIAAGPFTVMVKNRVKVHLEV